ncbi:fimbrial protein [Bordetella avium]|uniref:fimbrial protein n=2 Tax=Bordetella avium TaxID=521 RepID=UPI000E681E79|nr:fimbrial protein [Bordetella avium]AZY53775.1 fimbrial protein [Bordetella avium]RIQ19742.1 fimbrial protein [Bordetella avium]RIQ34322.1 fimbrial protein [Bordetella avium]RIQ70235.1 fimbrial protein [Bordetella avium]
MRRLLGFCMLLAWGTAAGQNDTQRSITVRGEVIETTCLINGGTSPVPLLVQLPRINAAVLKNQGDTAGDTPFTITLSKCPENFRGTVDVAFEPGPTSDFGTGNLKAYSSSASISTPANEMPSALGAVRDNVQIQITAADGTPIALTDKATPGGHGATLPGVADSSATLTYKARYIKTGSGPVSAGKLVTYVNFSIQYP